MTSEIKFASATAAKQRPGRKLTKSIFRQVVEIDWTNLSESSEILGWINYFWANCSEMDYENYEQTCLHVLVKKDEQLRRIVLPKINRLVGSGINFKDRHRHYLDDDECKKLKLLCDKVDKAGQLFLGDFCF